MRFRGEPAVRDSELPRVLLDPGYRHDHHVLQDLQGGGEATRRPEPGVQQHGAKQRDSRASLLRWFPTPLEDVAPAAAAPERRQRLRQAAALVPSLRGGAQRRER